MTNIFIVYGISKLSLILDGYLYFISFRIVAIFFGLKSVSLFSGAVKSNGIRFSD
jgi:hypothetical protein